MKLILSAILCCGLLAGGCTRSPVKAESAAAGGSPASCNSHGATVCRKGTVFRCEEGNWHSTFRPC